MSEFLSDTQLMRRTERGWAGHFVLSDSCRFRRNTLVQYGDTYIVVSTVGALMDSHNEGGYKALGIDRYYETMAFHARYDGYYWDADVDREVHINGETAINHIEPHADSDANDMHERCVQEVLIRMFDGEFEPKQQETT